MIFEVCFEKTRGVLQKWAKSCKMWDFVLQRNILSWQVCCVTKSGLLKSCHVLNTQEKKSFS